MALPTLRYCPPKSNRFIDPIASNADCNVSYSMNPYPLCLFGACPWANLQYFMDPKASKTLIKKITFYNYKLKKLNQKHKSS